MDNLLTDKDLETIARAHRRCGEMELSLIHISEPTRP